MSKLIFHLVTEGGGVELYYENGFYSRTANETASIDMLSDEDQKEIMEWLAAKPASPVFTSFEEAFESLATQYRVFSLIPLLIAPEYQAIVKKYFESAEKDPAYYERINTRRWKEALSDRQEDF